MSDHQRVRFHEEQRFPGWILLAVLATSSTTWFGFVWQVVLGHPFGSKPAPDWVLTLVFSVFGLGLPFLFVRLRLITDVTGELVRVRLSPLKTRVHRIEDILSCSAVQYSPIRDYGGWGIRYGGARVGWAYNVRGTSGVRLETRQGDRLLIGSQQAERLAQVINDAVRSVPLPPAHAMTPAIGLPPSVT